LSSFNLFKLHKFSLNKERQIEAAIS